MNSPGIVAGPPAFLFKAARQPMLWAAVVYSAGMVARVYAWRRALWWIVAVAMFIAAAAYFANRRSGLAWLLAFGTFFLAGALHIQMDSARPAFAIISVGSGNSFGLPRYETLARLVLVSIAPIWTGQSRSTSMVTRSRLLRRVLSTIDVSRFVVIPG